MPKMKTRKAAKKRFKKTGSGKLVRRGANKLHKSEHRPTKVMKRGAADQIVAKADEDRVKRMLGS